MLRLRGAEKENQECYRGGDCPRCPGRRDRSQCSIWIWPVSESKKVARKKKGAKSRSAESFRNTGDDRGYP